VQPFAVLTRTEGMAEPGTLHVEPELREKTRARKNDKYARQWRHRRVSLATSIRRNRAQGLAAGLRDVELRIRLSFRLESRDAQKPKAKSGNSRLLMPRKGADGPSLAFA
jgi:hypothetical protein